MFIPVLMHGIIGMASPWLLPAIVGGGFISHCSRRRTRYDEVDYPLPRRNSDIYQNWNPRNNWDENKSFTVR